MTRKSTFTMGFLMKMYKFLVMMICLLSVHKTVNGSTSDSIREWPFGNSGSIQLLDALKWGYELVKERPYIATVPLTLAGLYVVSSLQKQNPEFFSSLMRVVESPWFIFQKRMELLFCGGQSLTWNQLASWHNHMSKLLSPLTKATSVLDLGKERRLRAIEIEDGTENVQDTQWLTLSTHIQHECDFLAFVLTQRLRYYKEHPEKEVENRHLVVKALMVPVAGIKKVGKVLVRTSLTRNEEIAFGLEETIAYLKEVSEYCASISHFGALDKEIIKRLMVSICSTIEHLGVLVDEVSAADKSRKKLPMTLDGTLNKGYTPGSGFGGYDAMYGMAGS